MATIICTLGTDPADAALNRPVLVLRPEEVAGVGPFLDPAGAPALTALLDPSGPERRVAGSGQLSAVRRDLRGALAGIAAADLTDRLVLALALQRLDTACATAQEFGFNLYVAFAAE